MKDRMLYFLDGFLDRFSRPIDALWRWFFCPLFAFSLLAYCILRGLWAEWRRRRYD